MADKETKETLKAYTTDGDEWTAERDSKDEAWLVNYPEGSFRLHCTRTHIKKEMKRVMTEVGKYYDLTKGFISR